MFLLSNPTTKYDLNMMLHWQADKCLRESDFEFKGQLGEGAYAAVHRAQWQAKDKGKVAIKVFKLGPMAAGMLGVCSEAEAELRKMKDAQHPNVIRCFGLMIGPCKIGIVMELADGGDLARMIRENPGLPGRDRLKLAEGAASGLAFLHHRGMVHLDIKSSNLLIRSGVVKVSDFGQAEVVQTTHKATVSSRGRVGTSNFLAPEAWTEGPQAREKPVDVWSFGCVLHHLVEGREPWTDIKYQQLYDAVVGNKKCPELSLAKKQACQEKILIKLSTQCCKNNPHERPVFELIVEVLQRALRVLEEPDEKNLYVHLGGCTRAKACVDFLLSNDGLDQEACLIEARGTH